LRQKLVDLVLDVIRDQDDRIRVEDVISAAATIVGERCIDASGDFALRDHELAPGSRFLSTTVNQLICRDVGGSVDKVPKDSIVGILRGRLDTRVYSDTDFPMLSEVLRQHAARLGDPADWGKVPLSVAEDHRPFVPPLRVGYETRARVDEILASVGEDKVRCLWIATQALADILTMVASVIDHRLALTLAIETVNGMSKTAPMTVKAMQRIHQEVGKPSQ
jgi:hypothetical protein